MTRVIKATLDDDNNTIQATYAGGHIVSIPLPIGSQSANITPASESRLIWLAEHDPLDYARMAVNGELPDYIDAINGTNKEQSDHLTEWYKERYPDVSDTQISIMVANPCGMTRSIAKRLRDAL